MKFNKKRKGMDAHVLGLALGVVVLLLVLGVIVGLNTSGAFRDFLNKVPWLNKIIPDGGSDNPGPGVFVNNCGALCEFTLTSGGKLCSMEQVCKNNVCEINNECKNMLPYVGRPSGNVIHFIAPTKAAGGDRIRLKISEGKPVSGPMAGVSYEIRSGDVLEYDVYLPLKTPCTGGLYIDTTGDDLGDEVKWKDQNGITADLRDCDSNPAKVSKENDMTEYAYRKWYHRRLDMSGVVGKTLEKIALTMGGKTYDSGKDGVVYVALYDNIVITSSDGKHVFFDNSAAFLEKEGCGFWDGCRYDPDKTTAFVAPIAYTPPAPASAQADIAYQSGDIIKFTATGDGTGKWLYLKTYEIDSPYTIRPGDIIEYDIFLRTCEKEVGGIELRSKTDPINKWKDVAYWRWTYDWVNNKWLRATPDNSDMDLTELACNKWYHRILPAPPDRWNKHVDIVDLVIGYDAANGKQVLSYYDNIRITDGTGTVRWFYPGGPVFPPNSFDEKYDDGGVKGFKDVTFTATTPADINNP
ncbi:MAG: hypothetical protein HY515_02325 [Candidatus Aenigmarchaeota archaeon]|nr:hypothetical protein [Candidatus Aenigmarchaeota archaeon]